MNLLTEAFDENSVNTVDENGLNKISYRLSVISSITQGKFRGSVCILPITFAAVMTFGPNKK